MNIQTPVHHRLAEQLSREIEGEVLFDRIQPRTVCDRCLDLSDRAGWCRRTRSEVPTLKPRWRWRAKKVSAC